jgi:chromate reductase
LRTHLIKLTFFALIVSLFHERGGDSRLGDRVLNWVKNTISTRKETLGSQTITHDFYIVDPLEVFAPNGALSGFTGGELGAPVFFMKPEDLPQATKDLGDKIRDADCYLIVSPEYNHTIPPALSSVMGHFGGSNYKCKPSGIVTYSPSPFAGMRAAMAIQIMCHELGCLPVSKLCGIPNVSDILELDGTPKDPENRMLNQLPELLTQLEWMAVAMANQREKTGSF